MALHVYQVMQFPAAEVFSKVNQTAETINLQAKFSEMKRCEPTFFELQEMEISWINMVCGSSNDWLQAGIVADLCRKGLIQRQIQEELVSYSVELRQYVNNRTTNVTDKEDMPDATRKWFNRHSEDQSSLIKVSVDRGWALDYKDSSDLQVISEKVVYLLGMSGEVSGYYHRQSFMLYICVTPSKL